MQGGPQQGRKIQQKPETRSNGRGGNFVATSVPGNEAYMQYNTSANGTRRYE